MPTVGGNLLITRARHAVCVALECWINVFRNDRLVIVTHVTIIATCVILYSSSHRGDHCIRNVKPSKYQSQLYEQSTQIGSNNMALDDRLEETVSQLLMTRQCLRCMAVYADMDSVGAHECRYHPDLFQGAGAQMFGTDDCTWACCGVARDPRHRAWRGACMARGCRRCDHTSRIGLPNSLRIPLDRARVLFGHRLDVGSGRPGVSIDHSASVVVIVRAE